MCEVNDGRCMLLISPNQRKTPAPRTRNIDKEAKKKEVKRKRITTKNTKEDRIENLQGIIKR